MAELERRRLGKTGMTPRALGLGCAFFGGANVTDEEAVAGICQRHETIVVLEEHSIHGGLGSAVTEIAAAHCPTWVCRVGVQDRFSQYCGSYRYLMEEHGLDAAGVAAQVKRFLGRVGSRLQPRKSAA